MTTIETVDWGLEEVGSKFPYDEPMLRTTGIRFLGNFAAISKDTIQPVYAQDRFTGESELIANPRRWTMTFKAGEELTAGHFGVVRAVDVVNSAIRASQLMAESKISGLARSISEISGGFSLKRLIRTGETATAAAFKTDNALVEVGDELAAEVKGIELDFVEDKPVKGLTVVQRNNLRMELLEGAAHGGVGLALFDLERRQAEIRAGGGKVPERTPVVLYDGIEGPIRWYRDVFPGETVEYFVTKVDQPNRQIMQADIAAIIKDELVMEARGAKCRVRTLESIQNAHRFVTGV